MDSPRQRRTRTVTARLDRELARLDRIERSAIDRADFATARRVEARRARIYGLSR